MPEKNLSGEAGPARIFASRMQARGFSLALTLVLLYTSFVSPESCPIHRGLRPIAARGDLLEFSSAKRCEGLGLRLRGGCEEGGDEGEGEDGDKEAMDDEDEDEEEKAAKKKPKKMDIHSAIREASAA
jgi:hypothetical protein